MKEALTSSPKFVLWRQRLLDNGMSIREIDEIYTRYRHNGEALFSLVLLDALSPEGDKIPPICFLKGEVVCILVVLIDEANEDKYILLVRQRRICNGGLLYEPVAGMVDGTDTPHEVAVKEIEEETGLTVEPDQVIRINDEPYFASSGTSDEAMYFYYTELRMSLDQIMAYDGQKTGVDHEHEVIWTHVAPIKEAKQLITNTNGLLNLYMYEERSQAS